MGIFGQRGVSPLHRFPTGPHENHLSPPRRDQPSPFRGSTPQTWSECPRTSRGPSVSWTLFGSRKPLDAPPGDRPRPVPSAPCPSVNTSSPTPHSDPAKDFPDPGTQKGPSSSVTLSRGRETIGVDRWGNDGGTRIGEALGKSGRDGSGSGPNGRGGGRSTLWSGHVGGPVCRRGVRGGSRSVPSDGSEWTGVRPSCPLTGG